MPRELAEDPEATVFEYGAGISVPHDWEAWGALCRGLAEHLVERYGIDEVAGWGFEVWNEANLEVFWTGTRDEYFKLYDLAVEAVKSVDSRLLVGGPATAAAGWIPDFLDHVVEVGAPLDFLTTHTYGNLPLDIRESLRVRELDAEVWWTEWGVTPTHFYEISDSVFSATFLLHGMKSAQERADALAYWVVSDHFEELGRPPALLHGGFGLLTVGNLRKPRWWALALAEQLGDDLLPLTLDGDGAGTLVDGWAARGPDGDRRPAVERHARPVQGERRPAAGPHGDDHRPAAAATPRSRGWTSTTPTSRATGTASGRGRPRSSSPSCARTTACTSRTSASVDGVGDVRAADARHRATTASAAVRRSRHRCRACPRHARSTDSESTRSPTRAVTLTVR